MQHLLRPRGTKRIPLPIPLYRILRAMGIRSVWYESTRFDSFKSFSLSFFMHIF